MMAQICFDAEELENLLSAISFADSEGMLDISEETVKKLKDGLEMVKP